jgi:hypothetical protein
MKDQSRDHADPVAREATIDPPQQEVDQRASVENPVLLVEAMHRKAVGRMRNQPLPEAAPATIHWTQLPPPGPESQLAQEWNTYRREVGQFLAQGHEGRHVLIKREEIIGMWETHREAMAEGYRLFLGQAFLVHQIQERERLILFLSVRRCLNTPTH